MRSWLTNAVCREYRMPKSGRRERLRWAVVVVVGVVPRVARRRLDLTCLHYLHTRHLTCGF